MFQILKAQWKDQKGIHMLSYSLCLTTILPTEADFPQAPYFYLNDPKGISRGKEIPGGNPPFPWIGGCTVRGGTGRYE